MVDTVSDVLHAASLSASLNIILQISMRIVTFIINGIILRYVTSDIIGLINVRLLLLYTTIQFLSRESLRRASLSDAKSHKWFHVINCIWLCVPLSVVFGLIFSFIWCYVLSQPNPNVITHYHFAVFSIFISVIIEMFAEPLFIYGQLNSYIRLRVIIDGIFLLSRCLLMVIFVPQFPNYAVMIFAYSQIIASVIYTLIYYMYFALNINSHNNSAIKLNDFMPKIVKNEPYIDAAFLHLSLTFLKQTTLKQLLTEGERFVMTFFNVITLSEQGIYDIINNIGSLPARLVFHQIEESGYVLFSAKIDREKESVKQIRKELVESSVILRNLLKLMSLLGFVIIVFGINYSQLALLIYGGQMLGDSLGISLLQWHCVYILFIAINGVSESFTFASMSQKQIEEFNKKMFILSVLFLMSAFLLTNLFGSTGFIMANSLNMTIRILFSVKFISQYYGPTKVVSPLKGLFPNLTVIITFTFAFIILYISKVTLCCTFGLIQIIVFISIGIVLLFGVTIILSFKEKELYHFITKLFKREEMKDKKKS